MGSWDLVGGHGRRMSSTRGQNSQGKAEVGSKEERRDKLVGKDKV